MSIYRRSPLQQLSHLHRVQPPVMNRLTNSRRAVKRAGSLDDSASDSGKILSYQRMPQDIAVKAIPADGTAELSSQAVTSPSRGKHRARVVSDPSYRNGCATGRSEAYSSSETSRSRLSSANLEQNHHAYRNHPQNLDYHGEHLPVAQASCWLLILAAVASSTIVAQSEPKCCNA